MLIEETGIPDLLIISPKVFGDDRGSFFEVHNEERFEQHGLNYHFVQDNMSFSTYGVVRGMHYQTGAHAQAKLVQVLAGSVWDVAIDLRKESPTYGQSFGIELNNENKKQMLIPRGFAHGFSVLSPTAMFNYKCDNYYNKASEGGIKVNDDILNIDWKIPVDEQIIAERDLQFPSFGKHIAAL